MREINGWKCMWNKSWIAPYFSSGRLLHVGRDRRVGKSSVLLVFLSNGKTTNKYRSSSSVARTKHAERNPIYFVIRLLFFSIAQIREKNRTNWQKILFRNGPTDNTEPPKPLHIYIMRERYRKINVIFIITIISHFLH